MLIKKGLSMQSKKCLNKTFKRALDLISSILGIFILTPMFILIAVWIKIDSPGPAFFRQTRVGRFGVHFKIWKFRTMVVNAPSLGTAITVGDDPRITSSGKWLRKFKLDELPQLLNVIKGEMSLVGPRPEVPYYVQFYTAAQRQVLDLIPGITDLASIKYRNENELLAASAEEHEALDAEELYIKKVIPDKIRINLEYAREATILRDLVIILKTILMH